VPPFYDDIQIKICHAYHTTAEKRLTAEIPQNPAFFKKFPVPAFMVTLIVSSNIY